MGVRCFQNWGEKDMVSVKIKQEITPIIAINVFKNTIPQSFRNVGKLNCKEMYHQQEVLRGSQDRIIIK